MLVNDSFLDLLDEIDNAMASSVSTPVRQVAPPVTVTTSLGTPATLRQALVTPASIHQAAPEPIPSLQDSKTFMFLSNTKLLKLQSS